MKWAVTSETVKYGFEKSKFEVVCFYSIACGVKWMTHPQDQSRCADTVYHFTRCLNIITTVFPLFKNILIRNHRANVCASVHICQEGYKQKVTSVSCRAVKLRRTVVRWANESSSFCTGQHSHHLWWELFYLNCFRGVYFKWLVITLTEQNFKVLGLSSVPERLFVHMGANHVPSV